MFGAWQVGAWKALAPHWQPDLIVGASVGSLNGWAIAGGCTPQELERYWLESAAGRLRFRIPRHPLHGILDTRHLQQAIGDLYAAYRPQVEYAVVVTQARGLQPRIVRGNEVTAAHLLASCAVPAFFDQQIIGGRLYTDGGLRDAVPVWAALELGADRILALDAMPRLFGRAPRRLPENVIRIAPETSLGPFRQMLAWRRDRIEAWLAQGYRDASAKKHSLQKCFERE